MGTTTHIYGSKKVVYCASCENPICENDAFQYNADDEMVCIECEVEEIEEDDNPELDFNNLRIYGGDEPWLP